MIKLNGKKYKAVKYDGRRLNSYYYKGLLLDEQPPNKRVTQFTVDDSGDTIGIIKGFGVTPLTVLALIASLCFIVALFIFIRDFMSKYKYKSDIVPDSEIVTDAGVAITDTLSGSLVNGTYTLSYNQNTLYENNCIDLKYVNIEKECTVSVKGDGVSSKSVKVEPKATLEYLNITVEDSVEFPCRVNLIVNIDGEDYRCPLVINMYDGINYHAGKGVSASSSDNSNLTQEGSWEDPTSFDD